MAKKPLKATDRRRQRKRAESVDNTSDDNGAGKALADLYNDRRRRNGSGKRAT